MAEITGTKKEEEVGKEVIGEVEEAVEVKGGDEKVVEVEAEVKGDEGDEGEGEEQEQEPEQEPEQEQEPDHEPYHEDAESNEEQPAQSPGDIDEDIANLKKRKRTDEGENRKVKKAKEGKDVAKGEDEDVKGDEEDEKLDNTAIDATAASSVPTFEEKFAAALKKPTRRKKNNDVDLEAMQDEAISNLKNMMKEAAYDDIECVNNQKPATNKLRLLPQVKQTLLKSSLYDSILDNNLLEAVRIWLEPLPDGSLPSYEIQKTLLKELTKMPIKTIHLRESGLGKVIVFYQKSPIVDSTLKRTADKLISDWTRPIMGRSDNYRAKLVPTASFNPESYKADQRIHSGSVQKKAGRKTLYQESADRRKRAAAPEERTSVYSIAPQVNSEAFGRKSSVAAMGIGSSLSRDERFKRLNQKLTHLSQKKGGRSSKKGGVSIEGKGVNTF
ncbi:DEKNAAC104215 [Brettanomyces naardenensis]|uniref:DEKNAAC104215 n=1 Tax=Brettanomyces naardenensis TaxID=13370 RepID=A0A448YQM2_BRENA|nr:DEKNAAC104215 [Brettanomyces naardenensis]